MADGPGAHPGGRPGSRTSVRTAVVWQVLRAALADRLPPARPLDVLDAGGGTGGFAVPLAELGNRVTVVDPSPDSLAALERRAADAGVSALVAGRQGDAAGLLDVVPAGGYDVVLCHNVLEVVDDPAAAMAAVARTLRPGGLASVLATNRVAAVLSRVLAGRLGDAAALLADPAGRAGPGDPLARRFDQPQLVDLLVRAGLQPVATHGVRVFTDLVPDGLLDGEPGLCDALIGLERRAADDPAYRSLAAQLHVLARPR